MSDETAEGSLQVDVAQFLQALESLEESLASLQESFEKAAPAISGHLEEVDNAATKTSSAMDLLRAAGSRVSSAFSAALPHIQGFAHAIVEVSHFAGLIPSSLGFIGTAISSLTGHISPLGPKMVNAVNQWLPSIKQGLRAISVTDFAVQALQGRLGILGAAFGFVAGRALTGRTALSAFGAAAAYVVSKVVAAGRAITGVIRGITNTLMSSLGSIGSTIAAALPEFLPLIAAVGLLAAALVSLKKSVHESAAIEETTQSFSTFTDNADQAKKAVEGLIALSGHSGLFEKSEMLDAGKSLLGLKFGAEELVPMLTDIGDASARMNKPLGDMVGIFGKIKNGQFGEAFQGLHGFGISQEDLQAKGLKFDANHQFKGSAEEAMTAVRAVIQDKFGGTMDALSYTWGGLWKKLSTMVGENFRAIGDPILAQLKPILDQVVTAFGQTLPAARQLGAALAATFQLLGPVIVSIVSSSLRLLTTTIHYVNSLLAALEKVINAARQFLDLKPIKFQGVEEPKLKPKPDAIEDDEKPKRTAAAVGHLRELGGGGLFHIGATSGGDPMLDQSRRQTQLLEVLVSQGRTSPSGIPGIPTSVGL